MSTVPGHKRSLSGYTQSNQQRNRNSTSPLVSKNPAIKANAVVQSNNVPIKKSPDTFKNLAIVQKQQLAKSPQIYKKLVKTAVVSNNNTLKTKKYEVELDDNHQNYSSIKKSTNRENVPRTAQPSVNQINMQSQMSQIKRYNDVLSNEKKKADSENTNKSFNSKTGYKGLANPFTGTQKPLSGRKDLSRPSHLNETNKSVSLNRTFEKNINRSSLSKTPTPVSETSRIKADQEKRNSIDKKETKADSSNSNSNNSNHFVARSVVLNGGSQPNKDTTRKSVSPIGTSKQTIPGHTNNLNNSAIINKPMSNLGSSTVIKIANPLDKKPNFKEMNTSPFVRKPLPQKSGIAGKAQLNNTQQLKNYINSKINQLSSSTASYTDVKKPVTPSVIAKKIKNQSSISRVGFSGEGVKKVNQDVYFIYENFNDNINSQFIGVCDGHGTLGHHVSAYIKSNLPIAMDKEFKRLGASHYKKIMTDVFSDICYKLNNESQIDTKFSGTTCVTVVYTPQKAICANVGDSRAIIGRFIDGAWIPHALSRDHKPSDEDEKIRIIQNGGRIEAFKDEYGEFMGPERVWLPNIDVPGLAMSRSFGDTVAASVGCVAIPGKHFFYEEISEWTFTKEDKFLVVASDGIWEFLENEEIVETIGKFWESGKDPKEVAELLLQESTKRWLKEEEVIDDTTISITFFE